MLRARCWNSRCFNLHASLLAVLAILAGDCSAQQLNWIHARTPGGPTAAPVRRAGSAEQAPPAKPAVSQPMASARQAAVQAAAQQRPSMARRNVPPTPTAEGARSRAVEDSINAVVPAQYHADGYEDSGYGAPMIGPSCGVGCDCCEPTCGFVGDPSCGIPAGGCGDPCCGDACGCGDECCDTCRPILGSCGDRGCTPLILYLPPMRELTLFGGVQGHTGPLDKGRDGGNFGFNQGFNIGGEMAWLPWPGLGYQLGYRATQNQVNGDERIGTSDSHSQSFITAGLFRRAKCGWQYGVVYDMLRDERFESQDYGQVRGELSIVNPKGGEIGFAFASHTNENNIAVNQVQRTYHATNQYLLFYRLQGKQGGEFRAAAGFDDDSKGILAANFLVPLSKRWSLDTGFTYLIPEDSNDVNGREEAWNIGMNLVWHYGCRGDKYYCNPFRPLFNVADNGSLIVDDRE